jgi:putative transposase
MPKLRESPRLKQFSYLGPLAAHLTFVTRQRQSLFADPDLASICLETLFSTAEKFAATIYAYCVMPDHVHVLVGIREGASLKDFVHQFKQLAGFGLKRRTGAFAWQISYYDHTLRAEEALAEVAHYIWENPVKAGLAPTWFDYPFSGPRALMQDELGERSE